MPRTIPLALAILLATGPAWAQGTKQPSGFDDAPIAPNQEYRGKQGFSFQGDELPPSYDRKSFGRPDPRYQQTYQEQEQKVEKPGGGCLKYGAAGAVGGHFAGHTILGAIAGCAAGRVVRNRDKARIAAQQQQQQQYQR